MGEKMLLVGGVIEFIGFLMFMGLMIFNKTYDKSMNVHIRVNNGARPAAFTILFIGIALMIVGYILS